MRMVMRAVVLVALVCLASGAVSATVRVSHGAFTSGGKAIHYNWFHPAHHRRAPTVILLHGSGGVLGNAAWMTHYGEMLAGRGYNAVIVHYMERTGHTKVGDIPTMYVHFREWMQVVTDGITFASRRPEVDGRRMGLVGLSLGAYLSLATAARDRRIKAVVEYFGGLPQQFRNGHRPLPPVLVLHGVDDGMVPVDEAFSLMGYLEATKSPYDSRIYVNEGHGFSARIQSESEADALRFLQRHLQK